MANLENPVTVFGIEQELDELTVKDAARAATDGTNIDLSSSTDPNPIDGVSLNNGDRVLLKDQNDASENGIYDAVTATDPTTWTRSTDLDSSDEIRAGVFAFVEEGTNNADNGWVISTSDPINLGDDIDWSQFSGAGSSIDAGDGLTKSGSTIDVGAGTFITTNADDIEVNISNGLETDGADNIRVRADEVAGNVLSEGGNPYEVDLNIGNGVEDNSGTLRVNPAGIAGDGLKETSATSLGIEPDDFAGTNLEDDGSDNLRISTSAAGDGLQGGGSSALSVQVGDFAGAGLTTSGLPANLDVGDGNFITVNASTVDVNLGNGVEGDGSDNIRVNPGAIAGNGLEEATTTTLGIQTDGVQTDELDQSVTYTFTAVEEFQRTPGAGTADIVRFINGDNSDQWIRHLDGSDRFVEQVLDSSAATTRDIYRVDPSQAAQLDMLGTLNFPNITGTPTFASHDHSEGGMTTIPNAGLTNSSVTVTAGDGLKGGGSISLGGSTTVNIEPADFAGTFLSDDGSDNLEVDAGNGIENDGSDNIRVNPGAIAGQGLEEESTTDIGIDESASLTWTDRQEFDEFVTRQGRGQYPISVTHTSWADGLSDEEIFRLDLNSGEVMEVWRVECSQKGGGSSSNFSVDVFDNGASTELASVNLGSVSAGGTSPLGTSGAGNVILVRLSNSTGGPITASINIITYIVPN